MQTEQPPLLIARSPEIDTATLNIFYEGGRDNARYHITGEAVLPEGADVERLVLYVVGRVGARFAAVEDAHLNVDDRVGDRVAFDVRLEPRSGEQVDSIELRLTMTGYAQLGSRRFQKSQIPSAGDPNCGPVTGSAGDIQLAVQHRLDLTDANIDVMGLVPGDLPGVTRIMIELACLDSEGVALYHDENRSRRGQNVPHVFRETSYVKLGAWRASDAILIRLRAEFNAAGTTVTIPASAFSMAAADAE